MLRKKKSGRRASSSKREKSAPDLDAVQKKRFHARKLIQTALVSARRAECRKTNRSFKRLSDSDAGKDAIVASKKKETMEKLSERLAWMKTLTASDLLQLTGVPDTEAQTFTQPKPLSDGELNARQRGMLQKLLQGGEVKKAIDQYAALFQPEDHMDEAASDIEHESSSASDDDESNASGDENDADDTAAAAVNDNALAKALAKLQPLPDAIYATDSTSSDDDTGSDDNADTGGGNNMMNTSNATKESRTHKQKAGSFMVNYDDISDYDDDVVDTFASGDVDPSVTLGETDGSESGTRALSPVHHELESALAPEDISQEEDNTDVDDEAAEPVLDDPMFVSSLSSLSASTRAGKGSKKRKRGNDPVASVLAALMQHPAKPTAPRAGKKGTEEKTDSNQSPEKPQKKKKKRLGQMARQKRAEKMYGERARHVVNPTVDANKRQDIRRQQKREIRSNAKASHADKGKQRVGSGQRKQPVGGADEDGDLHPSWAAKRGLGDVAIKAFSGTKISFDDEGNGTSGSKSAGGNRNSGGKGDGNDRSSDRDKATLPRARATLASQTRGRQSWEAKQRLGTANVSRIPSERTSAAGEGMHPSWSAKAAEGVIKPFSGTKITFD